MQRQEILDIAHAKGVHTTERFTKADLIRAIQRAEGHFTCFGSASGSCVQRNCLWLEECLEAQKGV